MQNCGIESLVDELCAKLKEVKENSKETEEALPKSKPDSSKVSPQDLAKQYYAAFPALNRNSTSPLTTLPKWLESPKKRAKKNTSTSYVEKLLVKSEVDKKIKKPGHPGRYKKEVGYRNQAKASKRTESMADQDLYMFNDKMKSADCKTIWSEKLGMLPTYSMDTNDNEDTKTWSWNNYESNLNMYNNLPHEIRDLLNSPVPEEEPKKAEAPANSHVTATNNNCPWFDSIWSNDAPNDYCSFGSYNLFKDSKSWKNLGDELRTLTLNLPSAWPIQEAVKENERNVSAERQRSLFQAADMAFRDIDLGSIPWHISTNFEKWSDPERQDEEAEIAQVNKSLEKLLSTRGNSAFAEVYPRCKLYSMFCKHSNSMLYCKQDPIRKDSDDKEDLLTSEKTHFRPISEKSEDSSAGKYVDGTTFVIPSNLDKVEYKLIEDGNFYLEDENGVLCKYREYKTKYNQNAFIPKYKVIDNDMACQTDIDLSAIETSADLQTQDEDLMLDNQNIADDLKFYDYDFDDIWKPIDVATKKEYSSGDELLTRPDSVAAELFQNYEDLCETCSKKKQQSWSAKTKDSLLKIDTSDDSIWTVDICEECEKRKGNKPPLSQEQNQFRQDILRDGEQLLSDLNCWQQTYREGISAEIPHHVNELFYFKNIKRRHSTAVNYYGCMLIVDDTFSFVKQLEHAKLSSAIPSLRSVTL